MSEWQLLGLICVASLFRWVTVRTPEGVYISCFNRYFFPLLLVIVTGINGWLISRQYLLDSDIEKYPVLLILMLIALNIYILYRVFLYKFKKVGIGKKAEVYEWLDPIIVSGTVAFIVITFVMRTYYIPSESMLPTLQKNDYIFVNKLVYKFRKPVRNDIVVFIPPIPGEKRHFIKRIIGLPGETIKVEDGVVYINGKPLDEPFINEPPMLPYAERKIDDDKLLVMGDNRNDSDDSRSWGFLPMPRVEGKAEVIFWPPDRMRILR